MMSWAAQLIISTLYLAIAADQLLRANPWIALVYLAYGVAGGAMLVTLR